jgi:hypothetical protein
MVGYQGDHDGVEIFKIGMVPSNRVQTFTSLKVVQALTNT